jgi:hypothetical protein
MATKKAAPSLHSPALPSLATGAAAAPAIEPAAPAPKKRAVPRKAAAATAPKKAPVKKKAPAKEIVEPVISLSVLQDEIRAEAYGYFIQRGHRPGDPVADWHRAEDEVLRRHGLR